MKLSQLKQIIKEEINELGFDYPGKEQTPSAYQNGIMDTLKAMQQLGVNVDINAVMDILYPDDESPKDENPINENYVLDAMGTVLVGGVGLVLATAGVVGGAALAYDNIMYGPTADAIAKLKNKIDDRKFNKYIKPILIRFKDDKELQDMIEKGSTSKEIETYLESKLQPKELKYLEDISKSLWYSNYSKSDELEKI
jgi:AICAR transformylase/IMP cyclohydrolase PurH